MLPLKGDRGYWGKRWGGWGGVRWDRKGREGRESKKKGEKWKHHGEVRFCFVVPDGTVTIKFDFN